MKSRHLFLRRWFDRKTPANAGVFALKEGMRMVYVILFVLGIFIGFILAPYLIVLLAGFGLGIAVTLLIISFMKRKSKRNKEVK